MTLSRTNFQARAGVSKHIQRLEARLSIAASFIPELDHEMATTRALLERVPEGSADWKPHEKSFSLGELAMHVAILPGLGEKILSQEVVDLGAEDSGIPALETTAGMVELFDRLVAELRTTLAEVSDEELQVVWNLEAGGNVLVSLPRVAAYRTVLMNHLIHHRGQLSVYLRLLDVPLPPIYGPTADTQAEESASAT